jgi:replication factor C subunit 3/5
MIINDKSNIITNLNKFCFNPKVIEQLQSFLINKNEIPHIIIHGPSGSGKKSRIYAFLNEYYDSVIFNIKLQEYSFKLSSNKYCEFNYLKSIFHYEVDLSSYSYNDHDIISNFIKYISKSKNILNNNFKIVIFRNSQSLSILAQNSLRRIIEKYAENIRFIFITNVLNNITKPIKSRCVIIKNNAPTEQNTEQIIKELAIRQNIEITDQNIQTIITNNKKLYNTIDLNIIINMFELSFITNSYVEYNLPFLIIFDKIIEIITTPITKLNSKSFDSLKTLIYKLYSNNIDFTLFINYLIKYVLNNNFKDEIIHKIIEQSTILNDEIINSNKEIIHIEKCMFNIITFF